MRLRPVAAALALAAFPATAGMDHAGAIAALLESGLRAEIETAAMAASIRAQNAEHESVSQAEIDALDATWRAEVGAGGGPMVDRLLSAAASAALRDVQTRHGGLLTEIFVVDAHGLNVAQSDPTSDYWQGDEAKFLETYPKGPGAVFVDEVEFDESTQTLQAQVSFTFVDPADGTAIGAATAAVDVEMLFE